MKILITGGAGYIGAHTCCELYKAGYEAVIYDNLSNAHPEVVQRIAQIVGKRPTFVEGDVRDAALLQKTLRVHQCEGIIHFAGAKAVGESVEKPLDYYDNNLLGTIRIAQAMKVTDVRFVIFSSSATVYGEPQKLPLTEDHPLSAVNPYGHSKLVSEEILQNFVKVEPDFYVGLLRYFNPVGAHESGLIGEDPHGVPNNLMPYIAQVALGRREYLNVWGSDYDTPDGTGVRDYIHVVDLAIAHVRALEKLVRSRESFVVNLGTGKGSSVLDVVTAFEEASGVKIAVKIGPRRAGDVAACYASVDRASDYLGWQAERDLAQMCRDSWNWQSKNPNGYRLPRSKITNGGILRLFDVLFSFLGLMLGFPVFLALTVIGFFDTGSPLFCQTRVGRNRQPFTLVKFRTMRIGTASVATHLADATAVTRFGSFLRRTKLDELPQLWNVLKGEMSLVGPRPCLFNQTELIDERAKRGVYNGRPGITGLAQIQGIDMSTPCLLAETDAHMLSSIALSNYFSFVIKTAIGHGAGDRTGK